MIPKYIRLMAVTAATIGLAVVTTTAVPAQTHSSKQGQSAHSNGTGEMSQNLIWVRLLPFEWSRLGWQVEGENGQDVLNVIEELKPDVLDRFITDTPPDVNTEVPMSSGAAPMKFGDYLDAAMKAGAPGCFLTPKMGLKGRTDDFLLGAAQQLRDLPVTPRLDAMDLDTYYSQGTPEDHQQMLVKLKAMGWKYLGFNFAGGPKPASGLITYAEAGVSQTTWEVNLKSFDDMKQEGINIHLAHIDYPNAIIAFKQLSPDRQADIIQHISQEQHQYGFTFIYPVIYARKGYDATKEVTRSDGPYHGATVFQVIKEDIRCDRQYPKPCTPQFTGQAAAEGGGAPR